MNTNPSPAAKRYAFEGKQRSMREIHALVPVLSTTTIRKRLGEGLTTRVEMLAVDPALKRSAGAKKGNADRNAVSFAERFLEARR